MDKKIISFASDFGLIDGSVGIVKGVIKRIDPEVKIIDISDKIARDFIGNHDDIMKHLFKEANTWVDISLWQTKWDEIYRESHQSGRKGYQLDRLINFLSGFSKEISK